MEPLLTFGHGTAAAPTLLALLRRAGVGSVVDVRRFPGSRRNPDVGTDAMATWLPDGGIAYRWEPRLGGRRRVPADDDPGAEADADRWWRVEAFRAYAAHTRTDEFRAAMTELVAELAAGHGAQATDPGAQGTEPRRTAVMCSESLWWRCHRRLVSDVAVLLHGVEVQHLAHDGRLATHVPSAGARVAQDGLRYDLSGPGSPPARG